MLSYLQSPASSVHWYHLVFWTTSHDSHEKTCVEHETKTALYKHTPSCIVYNQVSNHKSHTALIRKQHQFDHALLYYVLKYIATD